MGGIRRALVRTIRYFMTHRAALAGLGLLMVAVIAGAVVLPARLLGGTSVAGLTGTLAGSASGDRAAAESFLQGNRDYDARRVWQSFSDEVRARMEARGTTVEELQRQLQAARASGYGIEEISYIGGKDLPNGTSMQFYLVGVRQQAQADLEYVPYLFTLDRGGKIAKVQ